MHNEIKIKKKKTLILGGERTAMEFHGCYKSIYFVNDDLRCFAAMIAIYKYLRESKIYFSHERKQSFIRFKDEFNRYYTLAINIKLSSDLRPIPVWQLWAVNEGFFSIKFLRSLLPKARRNKICWYRSRSNNLRIAY